jgi:hypothetical protein
MKVVCGFLDPVACIAPNGTPLRTAQDYETHMDSLSRLLGLSMIERSIDGKVYGLTNDGCFYVGQDWEQGQPLSNEADILKGLNENILLPLQLAFGGVPFRRMQFAGLFLGEKDVRGFVTRHILSPKAPTGSIEFDRFDERVAVGTHLQGSPFQNLHQFYKIQICKAYPHITFRDHSVYEAVWDHFLNWKRGASYVPPLGFLSQYFASARNGNFIEGYYAGVMFLEELFYQEIGRHKFAFVNAKSRFKYRAKTLGETTFGQKKQIMEYAKLWDGVSHKAEFKNIGDVRNDVFHRGYSPSMKELFEFDVVLRYFLYKFIGLDAPSLSILIEGI